MNPLMRERMERGGMKKVGSFMLLVGALLVGAALGHSVGLWIVAHVVIR